MGLDPGLEGIQLTLAVVVMLLTVGVEEKDGREALDINPLRVAVGGGIHLGNDDVVIILVGSTEL